MVKVVVEFKLKSGANIRPILLELKTNAITYPGFLGAEHFVDTKDTFHYTAISSWETAEDWANWEFSTSRTSIINKAEKVCSEPLRVTIYKQIPTVSWVD